MLSKVPSRAFVKSFNKPSISTQTTHSTLYSRFGIGSRTPPFQATSISRSLNTGRSHFQSLQIFNDHTARYRTFSSTPANMSLETATTINISDLPEGTMKEVELLGGKILLSNVKGTVNATSGLCSHYGLPLSKGVMDTSGRVVCFAHGACFNLCTGDIEDAPGLDGLHTYTATVDPSSGVISVTADPSIVKSKKGRSPTKSRGAIAKSAQADARKEEKVVIIGGGSGGIHCLESLREHGFKGKITLLSKEAYAPIDRTKLSKALVTDESKLVLRTVDELKNEFQVDFHPSTEVTKVDTTAKSVTTSTASTFEYDHLVLAPGSFAKKIPIPGSDLEGVKTLRGLTDAQEIVAGITKESKIVIIGTSFIGMEIAAAVAKKEPGSVDIIGVDKIPFEAILGPEVGKAIQKSLESQGVKFHMESNIEKIAASDSDSKTVGSVKLKDAPDLPCSMVIMGTGVAPATQFLADSGFKLEKDKGINVNEFMHVEDASGEPMKDVYALGDIAHYPQYPGKDKRRVEHWNVAGNTGRVIGQNIAVPEKAKPYTKIPIFWSSVGGGLRYVGSGAGQDEIHIVGDLEKELKFVGFYAKEDEITAVASIGRDPNVSQAAELMRLKLMPKLSEIKAGKNILDIKLDGKIGN